MTEEAEKTTETQTLRLTEMQASYVALAQRVHNGIMAEAQAIANQKAQEAQAILRKAVEGTFKEHEQPIPTAEVRIVNDERGQPASLVWDEKVEKAEESEEAATPEPEKPKTATNGKSLPPEAAKRKLPVK